MIRNKNTVKWHTIGWMYLKQRCNCRHHIGTDGRAASPYARCTAAICCSGRVVITRFLHTHTKHWLSYRCETKTQTTYLRLRDNRVDNHVRCHCIASWQLHIHTRIHTHTIYAWQQHHYAWQQHRTDCSREPRRKGDVSKSIGSDARRRECCNSASSLFSLACHTPPVNTHLNTFDNTVAYTGFGQQQLTVFAQSRQRRHMRYQNQQHACVRHIDLNIYTYIYIFIKKSVINFFNQTYRNQHACCQRRIFAQPTSNDTKPNTTRCRRILRWQSRINIWRSQVRKEFDNYKPINVLHHHEQT